MKREHQPDQGRFRAILSEDIEWKPFRALAAPAGLTVLTGRRDEVAPYFVRMRVPAGAVLGPRKHSEDRIYTVLSGVFYIGLGETFDGDELAAYPPGSVILLPGDTWHFHCAKSGEYVAQVSTIDSPGSDDRNPDDDPGCHSTDAMEDTANS